MNPFDDDVNPAPARRSTKRNAMRRTASRQQQQRDAEPAIWSARNVDWPIPSSLSLSTYQKLVKSSRQAGTSLDTSIEDTGEEGGEGQNYYGLSGLMSRVLNTSGASQNVDDLTDDEASVSGARPLRPPLPRCVAASNGWVVCALECGSLLRLVSRWNVRRGSSASSDPWIPLPGAGGDIVHVFVDPTGCHTLLSANNGEAYYLHSSSRAVQKLAGFGPNDTSGLTRGSYVTAVAWDKERGTEGSTKSILLGTNLGELYEYTLISPDATKTESDVTIPLLLHTLNTTQSGTDEMAAVTGLHFERIGSSGMLILIATSGRHKRTRLYTLFSLQIDTVRSLLMDGDSANRSLIELPGSIDFADLRLCNEHFALRTATGIYYGRIDNAAATATSGAGGIIVDAGILPYDSISRSSSSIPVSIALTPHHLITLSESNEVRFINRVAQKVIQKERVDWITSSGHSSGIDESLLSVGELMMDIRRPDQVWLRKGRALVHISSSCEDRDVWKFTLSKCLDMPSFSSLSSPRGGLATAARGSLAIPDLSRQTMSGAPTIPALTEEENALEAMFEHAKTLCTNTTQRAVVTAVRAEYHLVQGRTELAAKYLAQCPPPLAPFPDTSVRLALPMLDIDDPQSYSYSQKAKKSLASSNMALITYLSDKMRVAKMNDDGVVCTMIGAWLAELYLNERERSATSALGLASPRKNARAIEASHQFQLNQFLTNHVNSMDAKTIMRILASHDVSANECSSFAASSGDVGTAVNAALSVGSDELVSFNICPGGTLCGMNSSFCSLHNVPQNGVRDALRILKDAPFETAEPFYYKYAPTLLARAPADSCKAFLSCYPQGLSPSKLLPFIMNYESRREERRKTKHLRGKSESKVNEPTEIERLHVEGSKFSADAVEVRIDRMTLTQAESFIDDDSAVIKYLEGVIKIGCRSSAIYTYLVSLYAKMEDEEPLFRFLAIHVPAAATALEANKKILHSMEGNRFPTDSVSSPLDMSFALRTVLGTGRHFRSAIKLYMGFGMRQQAVELALKVDPSLARDLARESVDHDEQKRLWLMIARNAAAGVDNRGGRDVVTNVVSVLRDCGPEVLSIEDVLPFL